MTGTALPDIPHGGDGPIAAALLAVFRRDLRIALRRRADTGSALVFFVIVVSLFPLGVGPQYELLRRMAPGVVWVAALLASMLALGRLFADDHADGTLEQMLLSPAPLALLVLAKSAAHWLASGLLLVLISPLLALQFDLGAQAACVLMLSLLLGMPVLSLIQHGRAGLRRAFLAAGRDAAGRSGAGAAGGCRGAAHRFRVKRTRPAHPRSTGMGRARPRSRANPHGRAK